MSASRRRAHAGLPDARRLVLLAVLPLISLVLLAACAGVVRPDGPALALQPATASSPASDGVRAGVPGGAAARRIAAAPPDTWVRIGASADRDILMNHEAFETWGVLARSWILLLSKPDSEIRALGIDHELASYTADCSTYRIKVDDSRLYRADGSLYAARTDARKLRGVDDGTIGARVLEELCRSHEAQTRPFIPRGSR